MGFVEITVGRGILLLLGCFARRGIVVACYRPPLCVSTHGNVPLNIFRPIHFELNIWSTNTLCGVMLDISRLIYA